MLYILNFRMLAAERWQQEKQFVAHEINHLQKLQMQQVILLSFFCSLISKICFAVHLKRQINIPNWKPGLIILNLITHKRLHIETGSLGYRIL